VRYEELYGILTKIATLRFTSNSSPSDSLSKIFNTQFD